MLYTFIIFLLLWDVPGLYIEDVFVSKEYRGQGIGTALFKKCAYIAKENKCLRMEWSWFCKWNPVSRILLNHIGCKTYGRMGGVSFNR